ncbi:hypothetical protein SAMN02746089_01363 [Caldanaerobius fijiensis DSM 17918]|uniref:Uncharacterized protein n=1 Tax=Caldanaerobius fijiensis DSM 17918 TaxID=1121256 RepID=A0A1M4Z6Q2_9THEO|nr:CLC_0170 family protein [Caldanaerobius fijiensis]SHF13452.1 hypothetical protein SAMN02746089_01363 [Caldanaerobius fijiensis DSM 17918]
MNNILNYIRMRFDIYMLLLMLSMGIFLALIDTENLKKKELKKDEGIARKIGFFYIVFACAMYIIKSIWLR